MELSEVSPRPGNEPPKTKRGLKPRSQRNRKRARSQVRSNHDLVIQSHVIPPTLDGEVVATHVGVPFLRVLEPYPYTFTSYAKSRWIGRTILDVYSSEFGSFPESYYRAAIAQGRILVSDEAVDPSYCIKGKDVLLHTVHRHEPAVALSSDQPPYIDIVAETESLLAVNKPGTLPVHPCGGYHKNSLMNILEEHGYGKLHTIYRLDRLTSGLVILAKSSAQAAEWGRIIKDQRESCEKLYVARVRGRFPLGLLQQASSVASIPPLQLEEPMGPAPPMCGEWPHQGNTKAVARNGGKSDELAVEEAGSTNAFGYWLTDISGRHGDLTLQEFAAAENSLETWWQALQKKPAPPSNEADLSSTGLWWLHVACPVRIEDPKNGVCAFGTFADLDPATYRQTVKAAHTSFAVIRYHAESDSTVVLCRPLTGRTHQIRLHLQCLGHPIANDPNYGGSTWYGNPGGENAYHRAKSLLDAMDTANRQEMGNFSADNDDEAGRDEPSNVEPLVSSDVPATSQEIERLGQVVREEEEPLESFIRRTCVWCARARGDSITRTVLEFLVRSPGIWLHAWQYQVRPPGQDPICFRTRPPTWSLESRKTGGEV